MSAMRKPKEEKPDIQWIGLDQIRVDHSVQSREKMNVAEQREFTEAMLRGDEFPTITLFFDGKYYWLADGFHRVAAAKKVMEANPKMDQIRAIIHKGTKRNAMIFSAGANLKFSIKRTDEDKERAVRMILSDPECFVWSSVHMCEHCGVSRGFVERIRTAYCIENQVDRPDVILIRGGGQIRYKKPHSKVRVRLDATIHNGKKSSSFRVMIDGKDHRLGSDPAVAQEKYAEILKDRDARLTLIRGDLSAWLDRRQLRFVGCHCATRIHRSLSGFFGHGAIFVTADFTTKTSLWDEVGRLLLLKKAVGNAVLLNKFIAEPVTRLVIVCYPKDGLAELIALARQVEVPGIPAGIEFLTPEQLVASIKGDKPGGEQGDGE